jgi:imidazolonepropionase-like amidohydrolase
MKFKISIIALAVMVLISCSNQSELLEGENLLVLEGSNLIDGTGVSLSPNAAIVIQEAKIIRVGKAGDYKYPEDATVLDLHDRYVLPGFINVHIHLTPQELEEVLSTFLAFGITTIRDAAAVGGEEFLIGLREKISVGEVTGPRMLTAGRAINGHSSFDNYGFIFLCETEDEVKQEVRRQVEQGIDFIKVYAHLPADLVGAVIEEAHSHGLKVLGHLGKTSWTQAAEMGIDEVCHSAQGGPTWDLTPPDRRQEFQDNYMPPVDGVKNYDKAKLRRWRELIDLNGSEMERLVSALIDRGVHVTPTMVAFEVITWGNSSEARERLEPDFAPESMRKNWRQNDIHPSMIAWSPGHFEESQSSWPVFMDIMRTLHERGVPFAAGTDFGFPWITPGVSIHREMELLAAVGISPLDVLKIATSNGAEILGILDETGTIEVGKNADMVILTRNPIEDIRNTRSIETVIKNGQIYKPDDLLK